MEYSCTISGVDVVDLVGVVVSFSASPALPSWTKMLSGTVIRFRAAFFDVLEVLDRRGARARVVKLLLDPAYIRYDSITAATYGSCVCLLVMCSH